MRGAIGDVLPKVTKDREQRLATGQRATPANLRTISVHNRTLGLQMDELKAERLELQAELQLLQPHGRVLRAIRQLLPSDARVNRASCDAM